jgi:segregation and condensation protein A
MAYEVHLEMFEGPLDLLLFLIKKDNLDIHDIPVSHITREYLSYLDMIKELNLDVAGEFLVLATTLVAIKARTLLPAQAEQAQEGPDPRAELVAKLIEYQKFKQAAKFFEIRAEQFKDVFYRGAPHFDESEKSLSISLFDLLGTLREVLERCEDQTKEVLGEEFPIEEKIAKILYLLEGRASISLEEIFADERNRRGVIICFLALLELIKLQKAYARQDENFARIMIYKKTEPIKEVTADAASGNPIS